MDCCQQQIEAHHIPNRLSKTAVISPMTKLPKNRFFSLCATSRSWRCCRYGDSPSSLAGSAQPPASAPPTVSSVGLSGPIRLTATPHLCSVPGSAMGLSVHLKIICCSEFAVCLSSSFRSCEFLLFISSHDLHTQNF